MTHMARRNPPLIPADTSDDVWRRQMQAAADRSVAECLDEWEQLNEAVARMEADGIRRRHADYDDRQVLGSRPTSLRRRPRSCRMAETTPWSIHDRTGRSVPQLSW